MRNVKKIEWSAIYWKLVAASTTYDCLRCEKPFAANTMNQCDYHLSVPFSGIEPSENYYTCCNSAQPKFTGTGLKPTGCQVKFHAIL